MKKMAGSMCILVCILLCSTAIAGPLVERGTGSSDEEPSCVEFNAGNIKPLDIGKAYEVLIDLLSEMGAVFSAVGQTASGDTVDGLAIQTYGDAYVTEGGETVLSCAFVTIYHDELVDIYDSSGQHYYVDSIVSIELRQFIHENIFYKISVEDNVICLQTEPLVESPDVDGFDNQVLEYYTSSRLGLYSFDGDKYLIPPDVTDGSLRGYSTFVRVDEETIRAEIEHYRSMFRAQNTQWRSTEWITTYYSSVDAVIASFSSGRIPAINGKPISEIEAQIASLDPNDLIIFNAAGELDKIRIPDMASTEERIWTGFLCTAICLLSITATVLSGGLAIGAIAGAAVGFASQIFTDVVIDGKPYDQVNLSKLLISTGLGAAFGPTFSGLKGMAMSSLGSGLTSAAFSLIDGDGVDAAIFNGICGTVLGILGTVGVGAFSKIVKTVHIPKGKVLPAEEALLHNVSSDIGHTSSRQTSKELASAFSHKVVKAELYEKFPDAPTITKVFGISDSTILPYSNGSGYMISGGGMFHGSQIHHVSFFPNEGKPLAHVHLRQNGDFDLIDIQIIPNNGSFTTRITKAEGDIITRDIVDMTGKIHRNVPTCKVLRIQYDGELNQEMINSLLDATSKDAASQVGARSWVVKKAYWKVTDHGGEWNEYEGLA